jgi:hypothetical protein
MASNPAITHVTSFAEIRERLQNKPLRAAKAWHKRTKHSYRAGQPCDHCGQTDWAIGRKTAECRNPKCCNTLLLEATI